MTAIYVKPRAGGRVRMPERGSRPMPTEGSWVPRGDYYERLLISGDVVICEPPAEKAPAKREVPSGKAKPSQAAQSASTPAAGLTRPAKET
jgi:hypothetical protein